MKITFYTLLCALFLNSPAFALSYLQLDASEGDYNVDTESVAATSNAFTLYALIAPDKDPDYENKAENDPALDRTFYISVALTNKYTPIKEGDNGDYASVDITVDGTESTTYHFDFVKNAIYGVPPAAIDDPDLPTHGTYPTYYYEFAFTLDPDKKASSYNSQDDPGGLVTTDSDKDFLYYSAFDVDISALEKDYELHFDLYSIIYNADGSISYIEKAPFSHDVESAVGDDNPGDAPVPEPASIFLFGLGLLGMAGASRKKLL